MGDHNERRRPCDEKLECVVADKFRNPDISECFGMVYFGEILLCSFEAVRSYWKIIGHSHSKSFTLLASNGQCYHQVGCLVSNILLS